MSLTPQRAARPARLIAAAALLAGPLACARNPAFGDSGGDADSTTSATTTGSTSTTTTASTDGPTTTSLTDPLATTGPEAPCPDGQPPSLWYPDADTDGHGDRDAAPTEACEAPAGMLPGHDDCNDAISQIHPDVLEQCNSIDDNCNEMVDESLPDCGACVLEIGENFVYWICPEPDPISFDAAAQRCAERSITSPVHLASVHDALEHELLLDLVGEHLPPVNDERHAWIGARKKDGPDKTCDTPDPIADWRWVDATPFDFPPPWGPDEPNNENCDENDDIFENCVEIKLAPQQNIAGWNDTSCDLSIVAAYICRTARDPNLFPG